MRLRRTFTLTSASARVARSGVVENDLTNTDENAVAAHSAKSVKSRFGRVTAVLSIMALATSIAVLTAPTASAAALTNTTWSVSNNQVSATAVTYSYSFKTATAGTIKTITFVVSGAGLAGAPVIVKNYGISAGTVARAGQTITYTVTAAAAIPINIPIYIELSGMTNSSTIGAYTTAITTNTVTPTVIDGPTNTNAVNLAGSNTAVTVTIAKSATFTIDTAAFTLAMDPSLPALADQSQTVGLTVLTNANSGYTLTVGDLATGLQSSSTGNPFIADVSAGKGAALAWPGANKFGYTVTATGATADAAFQPGEPYRRDRRHDQHRQPGCHRLRSSDGRLY